MDQANPLVLKTNQHEHKGSVTVKMSFPAIYVASIRESQDQLVLTVLVGDEGSVGSSRERLVMKTALIKTAMKNPAASNGE